MMWLIIIALAVVQMVGIMTILHFKSKVKEVESENKELNDIIETIPESKPAWEELGLTEEEYKETRNMVYSVHSSSIPLYVPGIDDVEIPIDSDEKITNEDEIVEPIQKSELGDLLGIQDSKELEKLQKEIEEGNTSQQPTSTPPIEPKESDDIFGPTPPITEEDLQKVMEEIEEGVTQPPEKPEAQVAPLGGAADLFDEISKSINNEDISFSENEQQSTTYVDETPILPSDEDASILPSDEDAPMYEPEEEDVREQARMIEILNLLDFENNRMNEELDVTEYLDATVLAKQEIATKLAILSSEEGTNNMREIVNLLSQLYELEGKEEDMKALREEYKEYFEDAPIAIQIFEEDIISTGKEDGEEPIDIPEKYLWLASAKIADGLEGKQRWVGRVIGFNDNSGLKFIHFRDISQRIWINISSLNDKTIQKDDILTIFIVRNGENIIAEDIQHIKKIEN